MKTNYLKRISAYNIIRGQQFKSRNRAQVTESISVLVRSLSDPRETMRTDYTVGIDRVDIRKNLAVNKFRGKPEVRKTYS